MGLDLRKARVINDRQVERRAQEIYQLLEDLKHQIRSELGIDEMPAPKSQPTPIAEVDVAEISDRELGALYTQYVAYAVFLNGKLAEVTSLEKAAKGNLKRIIATIKNELRTQGAKDSELATLTELHPLYEEYYVEALKLSMMHEIVKADHGAYSDMAAALSRNITLRGQELEQLRRDDNVNKIKQAASQRSPRARGFGRR